MIEKFKKFGCERFIGSGFGLTGEDAIKIEEKLERKLNLVTNDGKKRRNFGNLFLYAEGNFPD